MKLAEYISREIDKGRRYFDVGIWKGMTVDNSPPNRIQFQVAPRQEILATTPKRRFTNNRVNPIRHLCALVDITVLRCDLTLYRMS